MQRFQLTTSSPPAGGDRAAPAQLVTNSCRDTAKYTFRYLPVFSPNHIAIFAWHVGMGTSYRIAIFARDFEIKDNDIILPTYRAISRARARRRPVTGLCGGAHTPDTWSSPSGIHGGASKIFKMFILTPGRAKHHAQNRHAPFCLSVKSGWPGAAAARGSGVGPRVHWLLTEGACRGSAVLV